MPMIVRLIKLASSPTGRRLIRTAHTAARDPKNRERLLEARARLKKRYG